MQGLTIGSFDGVHLGHQALISHLKSISTHVVVFTFSNHPSHLFIPHSPIPQIYPTEQKIRLLREAGADEVIVIPFTKTFSETPYEEFLTSIKERLNFSVLVLGEGATFGKNRAGDEAHVKALGEKLHFETTYIPKRFLGTHPISSGRIRKAIHSGNLTEATSCLGRPYSLQGHWQTDNIHSTLSLKGICLPPTGEYSVRIDKKTFTAFVDQKNAQIHINIPIINKEIFFTN